MYSSNKPFNNFRTGNTGENPVVSNEISSKNQDTRHFCKSTLTRSHTAKFQKIKICKFDSKQTSDKISYSNLKKF